MTSISFTIVAVTLLGWNKIRESRLYIRFLLYSVSVISIFSATYQQSLSVLDWGEGKLYIDLLILALVIFLVLSIRMTRRELFRLDTQDILVLLVLGASSVLVVGFDSGDQILSAIIRLAVLLYASEYVVGRVKGFTTVKALTVLAFLMIGVTGVL